MSDASFTGERLHQDDPLFAVDLARHRAAYRFALPLLEGGRVLDYGCGSGYGTEELRRAGVRIVGLDLVAPDVSFRGSGGVFLRGNVNAPPIREGSFDRILSFQVIEHLEDPVPYLDSIVRSLAAGGTFIVTTPNRLTSDGVNPFHVHEYLAQELETILGRRFGKVELRGVGMSPAVAAYSEERLRRIRRIMRIDPLGLHRRLPSGLVHWLFGRFARLVRSGIQGDSGLPEVSWSDFPIGEAEDGCLDLLAICREPR